MAGETLKKRAFYRLGSTDIEDVKDILRQAIHHIDMQDKEIERLKKRNNKLERKYWQIKLKYEEE